jgi:aminopeptidase N
MMPAMHRQGAAAVALSAILSGSPGCSKPADMPSTASPRPPAPAAGVPLSLAGERAARVRDLRYELHFRIPEAHGEPVIGTATLRFRLTDATRPLALDFAGPATSLSGLTAGGRSIVAEVRDEHVILPPSSLRASDNEIALSFQSNDLALNRSPEFLYSLFVPARARLAFPCFDQPDVKARYTLSLDIPSAWVAVSNGEERSRTAAEGRLRLAFAETKPIPTYLFAFAAGRFSVETALRGGRRFRMVHRETDADKLARNRDAVFDLHATALEWLEQYTGIRYPFEKFDFLLVPSFQFGGMEHPGAIFYSASALLLDPSATQNQKLGRASLIAHETAHMWFGDLVTMRWFNDVWMKEVFANFMAAKIVNPAFPDVNHDLRFLFAHYPTAYEVDRTPGTNAIRQRLENLNEAGSLYGAIIYQKAPIVMRQLEMILTPDGLRDGLREYLSQHAYGNAAWPDLIRMLDTRTSEDLAAWSRTWVEEAGRPIVTTTALRQQETGLAATFTQADPQPERGLGWSQRALFSVGFANRVHTAPVQLAFGSQDAGVRTTTVHLDQMGTSSGDGPLRYLLPTGGGLAYGDFVLDDQSRAYLTAHLADLDDALTRGAALVTLWEQMLSGRIASEAMFDTLVAALPRETDELNVARMLGYTQQAFWKFLAPEQREARAPALEGMLKRGLDRAKTSSLKSAWFNSLRDVACTRPSVEWLVRVWRKSAAVPGLTLAEPDYITLALELAVREVPSWHQILEEQTTRIQNPDRRDQFAFVRPALSAEPAVRDGFFERLRDVRNRRREAWVLQALAYLHHPLRAATSEKYIGPSLEMLRDIQRTGDIFFPKRWMDATLSGHRSESAAARVSAFLERMPKDYPERLRRIVLSSADDLFRASRTR